MNFEEERRIRRKRALKERRRLEQFAKKSDNCIVAENIGNYIIPIIYISKKQNGKWVIKNKLISSYKEFEEIIIDCKVKHIPIIYFGFTIGAIEQLMSINELRENREVNSSKPDIKKYIGIVKITHENMMGVSESFLSRFSDDVEYLKEWFNLYPGCEHTLLENNKELNSMFEIYEDMTPITEEEHKEQERVRKLYNNIMKED